jgi:hypothetical protein
MGLVSPDDWLPTHLETALINETDGEPLAGQINWNEKFVSGGAGSIFSAAALQALDTSNCIHEMRPDGSWWQYQSDWAIAACSLQARLRPQGAVKGAFSQHVCLEGGIRPFYCRTLGTRQDRNATGGLKAWDGKGIYVRNVAETYLTQPATIHPVKNLEAFQYLYRRYNSSTEYATALEGIPASEIPSLVPGSATNETLPEASSGEGAQIIKGAEQQQQQQQVGNAGQASHLEVPDTRVTPPSRKARR